MNVGFENGNSANYSYRSIVVNTNFHLDNFCTVNNNSGAFASNTALINQYQENVTIVRSGSEPFLLGLNININKVKTGQFALKL